MEAIPVATDPTTNTTPTVPEWAEKAIDALGRIPLAHLTPAVQSLIDERAGGQGGRTTRHCVPGGRRGVRDDAGGSRASGRTPQATRGARPVVTRPRWG